MTIAPLALTLPIATGVSMSVTGPLAQTVAQHHFVGDFSLFGPVQNFIPTMWVFPDGVSPFQDGQLQSVPEHGDLFEEFQSWENEAPPLPTRALHFLDSNPFVQASLAIGGIAAMAGIGFYLKNKIARPLQNRPRRLSTLNPIPQAGESSLSRSQPVETPGQTLQPPTRSSPVPGLPIAKTISPPGTVSHFADSQTVPHQIGPHPAPPLPRGLNPKMIPGFTIEQLLGTGGMAEVYLAHRDKHPKEKVAIKLISEDALMKSSTVKQRFEREALAMQAASHPNIVRIEKIGEADGKSYIIMEYVDGGTLLDWIGKQFKACWKQEMTQQDLERNVAELFIKILDALDVIHRLGIIHRDIKPANILLTRDGMPKISDFGVIAWMDRESLSQLTRPGGKVGTYEFFAPELVSVPVGSEVPWSVQVDIYAMGIILFFALTGQHPYKRKGDSNETLLARIAQGDLPNPKHFNRALSSAVTNIIKKALAKNPQARYRTAAAFSFDLRKLVHPRQVFSRRQLKASVG